MDIKKIKEILLEEKATIEEELQDIARFNPETEQWEAMPNTDMMGEADDNDAADRFEDFEERTSMLHTLQARLTDINIAMSKTDGKNFGICENGNDHPIEADRLEANPAARMCKLHMNG
ncbi:MAG: hypothetical protein KBC11_03030 [Candidatus Pacebacteria bacterium]|nr:hypothetical protein [Candidatus Paceibacterota bacterium]